MEVRSSESGREKRAEKVTERNVRKEARMLSLRRGTAEPEDLQKLDARLDTLIGMARARGTQVRYEKILQEFESFAAWVGEEKALPASEVMVRRFIAYLEMSGSPGVVGEAVAALGGWHRDRGLETPTESHMVRYAVKATKKIWAESKGEGRRRDPFPLEALREWVRCKPEGVNQQRWVRDAAMVALGLRLMLRPSELAGIRRKHIRLDGKGWLWVKIAKRKTDQLGQRGEDPIEPVKGSPTCVVRLVRALMNDMGPEVSPEAFLFVSLTTGKGISTSVVNTTVKHMVEKSQTTKECVVAGHSLRIGGCVAGMMGGFTMAQLKAVGGWCSKAMRAYLRSVSCASEGASQKMGF
jgi:hypothetical protein